ncbi:twin-arginine translocation signal domain-containing protein [Chloroflexi bacterium TSY]|nr:twin-arginine translocation signal domain-containing protein [Chloroflexi bacterium TSY]
MKHPISRRQFLKVTGLIGLGAALTACAPAATPSSDGAAPSSEMTEVLMWYQAENHEPEYTGRKAEFEERFGISLTYEILGRDAMTKKLPTTLMAGSGFPDILEQNAGDIVGFMKGEDAQIPMLALNEFIDNSPYADAVLQSRWARYTKDGKIYGAPHDVHPIVMIYNDVLWQEFGVDVASLNSWDDLLAACQAVGPELGDQDGNQRFPIMDSLNASTLPTMMLQNGVWWTGEDGEPTLADPNFKVAVDNWMRFKDYRTDIDWGAHTAMLKSGQILMQPVPDWFYGIHKQAASEDPDFLADSPMRVRTVPDGPATGSWGGTACSVLKASPIAPEAVDIMLYIYFENGENQLDTRWLETGILPPVPAAWETDAYKEGDDYVGGQVSGEVFVEAAKALPPYFENWKTNLVVSAWNEQFSLAWEGEISVDEAIETADANAREQIEQNA